nr:purine-nucleoside phosphorylase [uncultured Peptostreptococcus sp.]
MADLYDNVLNSVKYIKKSYVGDIDIALILGSGLSYLVEQFENKIELAYKDIPNFHTSQVEGHENTLVIGDFCGKKVLAMKGRFHYYEGYSQSDITYPIRVFKGLGIDKILVTNAAGGCNKDFKPGDLMLIRDHINFSGSNPLIGPNDDRLGTRFPDMTKAYDPQGLELMKKCAGELGFDVQEGVYMFFSGPSYETPAEVRLAGILGADAVGMSTVPEVIVARYCGMKVFGISCITNMAAGITGENLNHEEVIDTTDRVKSKFSSLVKLFIEKV